MNEIAQHLDILVVVIGAALGSFKASQEFDKDKPFCNRSIDVAIGIFVGLSMAFHWRSISHILLLVLGIFKHPCSGLRWHS